MIPTNIIDYEDKKIFVYENVFNQRENFKIYDLIVNCQFTRTNIDVYFVNNLDRDAKWWHVIDPKSELSGIINSRYMNAARELDWNNVAITSQYVNYGTSNTVDVLHSDDVSNSGKTSYTILHYANHNWNVNWHGETLFYSDNCQEVIYTQLIKPGTCIVFDSRIQHSASPCTIAAEHPRFTIATKLFLKN
jgi:hypothetical protein